MSRTLEESVNRVLAEAASKNTARSDLCGQTLLKIFSNILENPSDSRHRTLNTASRALKERVFCLKGTQELLLTLGWQKDGDIFIFPVEAALDSLRVVASSLQDVAMTSPRGPVGISSTEMADQILAGRRERNDWFARLFGFKEWTNQNYIKTRQAFSYNPNNGVLKSRAASGREFVAGFFSTPSLEELRARVDLDSARKLDSEELEMIRINDDAGRLHNAEENHGAVFQCSSHFNCLAHASPAGKAEDGITCYSSLKTQGPSCALACPAGTVVRNYFAFGGEHAQSIDSQVTNLKDVEALLGNKLGSEGERYFQVRCGHTLANEGNLTQLKKVLDEDERLQEEVRKNLRVGVQSGTEVLTSGHGRSLRPAESEQQLVTQVHCSALSVGFSGCSSSLWSTFASIVLEANYEATLLVGIENALQNPHIPGSRKVFLTAVGSGAFGNSRSWIDSAMYKATEKFKDIGLKVYIVTQSYIS